MPSEQPAAARPQAESGEHELPGSIHTSTTNTDDITSAELTAAEREIAIESLRYAVAHNALTTDQRALLERRRAEDPSFATALDAAVEETRKQERKSAYVDQLATMLVTRNISIEFEQLIHLKRTTMPEFKGMLDAAIAVKQSDPVVLAEKERVMKWRREVERRKHYHVWNLWHAENVEKARREAAMRDSAR